MINNLMKTIVSLILACLIVAPVQAATQMYFIHNDHLGTPQVVTDQSQAVVWQGHQTPFGVVEETTATVEQLSRFPGQYFDEESGLSYNYFRDYDSSTGRYIQSDPIGLRGGINTYGYVGGNPIMSYDMYGLVECSCVAASSGGIGYKDGVKQCRYTCTPIDPNDGDSYEVDAPGVNSSRGDYCQGADVTTEYNRHKEDWVNVTNGLEPFLVDTEDYWFYQSDTQKAVEDAHNASQEE